MATTEAGGTEIPSNAVLMVEITNIRHDLTQLEELLGTVKHEFDEAEGRQGTRIGLLEQDMIQVRRDFYWATRLAISIGVLAQGVLLTIFAYYLKLGMTS